MEQTGENSRETVAAEAARLVAAVREARPLVQLITNLVSMDLAANVLLAAGAAPAMVSAPEESPEFVRRAAALVINTGTLSAASAHAMETATTAARTHGVPWVLDPVGAGGTKFRDETICKLLRHRPAVIRGNASEILAVARLAGLTQEAGAPRGVDSAHDTSEVEALAQKLARHGLCIVAATGAVDVVTDGRMLVRLANGSPMMTKVTALGCALTGYVGAFIGLGVAPFTATVSALGAYAVAGDIAAEHAAGPASFRTAFIDALYALDATDITTRLRIA
jgi:hydroxyethylthiazole kinase